MRCGHLKLKRRNKIKRYGVLNCVFESMEFDLMIDPIDLIPLLPFIFISE